ncbi:RICIN domain-containing protein [Streptomyces sp. NPDC046161]|uniref:RICIN domain-containing protein n=1 Tax=Streptomyces sp. NPDC046161 TaxID=3155132 RepID=UPI0033EEDAF2
MTRNKQNKRGPTSRFLCRKATLGLLAAGVLTAAFAVNPSGGTAGAASAARWPARDPDACAAGSAWRLTTPDDHVCIGPSRRSQVNFDTFQGQFLRDPNASNGCKSGFRPREAVPGDGVCVTPSEWNEVQRDADRAPSYWQATADRFVWGNLVPHPFAYASLDYEITSNYTREGNGEHVLAANVEGGSTDNGARLILWPSVSGGANQEFLFRTPRTRNGNAYHNRFEIVARHSGKCLDVAWAGTRDGDRVIQWGCHGGANQLWYLERRADNTWQIRNYNSDKCLDAHNPAVNNPPKQRTYLQQWTCLGNMNQSWRIRH